MQLSFDRAASRDFESGVHREWLVTNGLGGYASSTLPGLNTRRYHGLLVAAIKPPVERVNLLVRLNEVVGVAGETVDLMTAEYQGGSIFPAGYTHLESFALEDGLPIASYSIGSALLRRTIWMIPGHNITVVRYKLAVAGEPLDLALRPLTAARDHHSCQRGNHNWHFAVDRVADGVRVQATPQSPPLWLLGRGSDFRAAGDWYWNFLLREERARGYDYIEDLYQPGTFHVTLEPGASFTFIASAEDPAEGLPDPDAALGERRTMRARITAKAPSTAPVPSLEPELLPTLATAAAQFVVNRAPLGSQEPVQISVIAGYHWFTDWGRDAMICLPGLLLQADAIEEAASLLRTFAAYIDQGMIPNRFPDTGKEAEYNTADASLLFFQALRATLQAGADRSLLLDLYPRLCEIIDWHLRGTRYGIGVDPEDGLLRAGEVGTDAGVLATQLTWMDARSGDTVFTPRVGKPVEINAFWIEALSLMAAWAPEAGADPAPYREAAQRARSSFAARFWYAEGGYLYDVVDGPEGDDHRLRPNQLFALAFESSLVPDAQARAALAVVSEKLLTPYGLRSLSPDDPLYVGVCAGDQPTRDRAYHNGTVWPLLLAPYADAHSRLHRDGLALATLLEPFQAHLHEAGLGSISEIFDGDAPHTPRGCIAQGWSVNALLRIAQHVLDLATVDPVKAGAR